MDNETTTIKHPEYYCLTSNRHLRYALDFGIITPEVVATKNGSVRVFSRIELGGLPEKENYPSKPILIELSSTVNLKSIVIPVTAIKAIYFPSQNAIEDYLIRGYENVPDNLFTFNVSSELFQSDGQTNVNFVLEQNPNRQLLKEKFRPFNVLGGLLWDCIEKAVFINNLKNVIEKASLYFTQNELELWLLRQLYQNHATDETIMILVSYLRQLNDFDVSAGWVASEILEKTISDLPENIRNDDAISKWIVFCKGVINKQRDFEPHMLSDDKSIVLRAILLHLLNPDTDSINRLANRDNPPGAMVTETARLLARARIGFASILATDKQMFSGRYYLISELLTGFINENTVNPDKLTFTKTALLWDKKPVISFSVEKETVNQQVTSEVEVSLFGFESGNENNAQQPVINQDHSGSKEQSKNLAETIQPAQSKTIKQFVDIEHILKSINCVENLFIDQNNQTRFHLKEKILGGARKCEFSIIYPDDKDKHIIIKTVLLNLSVKNQAKALTKERLMESIKFQSVQKSYFRFELIPGEAFIAAVYISSADTINSQVFEDGINMLVKSHEWMNQ